MLNIRIDGPTVAVIDVFSRGCPTCQPAPTVDFNKVVRSITQLSKNAPAVGQFVLTD